MKVLSQIFFYALFFSFTLLLSKDHLNNESNKNIKLYWGLLGSYPHELHLNPYKLTRDDKSIDVASILYCIRRNYKNLEEISSETQIEKDTIGKKMRELVICDLVSEVNNEFIVTFPFWDAQLRDEINRLGKELTNRVVEVIKSEIPNLKEIFKNSSLKEQGYTWDEVSLVIIGSMLLDTGLNDRGLRKREIFVQKRDTPVRPGNYLYWYKAVENSWGNYWKFGNNQISNETKDIWVGRFYGNVKGRKWKRKNIDKIWKLFDKNTKKILFPIIKNDHISIKELEANLNISKDSLESILDKMINSEIIKIQNSIVYVNFPIFTDKDINILLKEVDIICNRIIDDIFIPYIPIIMESWRKFEPKNWNIKSIDKFYLREVFDRPYNLTLDKLIREGILPPSPKEPPFDYWGVNGTFEVL